MATPPLNQDPNSVVPIQTYQPANPDPNALMATYNVNPADTFSAANITNTITSPTAPPDLSDPFGIAAYYDTQYNVGGLRNDVAGINARISEFDTNSANFMNQIENGRVGMNVIRGEQDKASRAAAVTRQGLLNELGIKQAALDTAIGQASKGVEIANNERGRLQELIANAPGAGIKYTDSFEDAAEKASDWNYKQTLKSKLSELGLKTSGSKKELEKRLRKYNKSAAEEAKRDRDMDYKLKVKELNKPYYKEDGASEGDIQTANENDVFSILTSLRRAEKSRGDASDDGYINPNDWRPIMDKWVEAGGGAMDFLKKFEQFINPADV